LITNNLILLESH